MPRVRKDREASGGRANTVEKVLAHVAAQPSGCWLHAKLKPRADGYVTVTVAGRTHRLHRLVYAERVGPIPERLVLDHTCRNRACCRPEHLEPVSNKVNTLRGLAPSAANHRKAECVRGHPFDEKNAYRRREGGRRCRACNAAEARKYRARVRERRKAETTRETT